MTRDANDKSVVVVRARPLEPARPGEITRWTRFAASIKKLLAFGAWQGTRAADAKVDQMEAEARQTDAKTRRIEADITKKELDNADRTFALLEKILNSDQHSDVKDAELEILGRANPEFAEAIGRLRASKEAITSRGAEICETSETPPAPPTKLRRQRLTSDK